LRLSGERGKPEQQFTIETARKREVFLPAPRKGKPRLVYLLWKKRRKRKPRKNPQNFLEGESYFSSKKKIRNSYGKPILRTRKEEFGARTGKKGGGKGAHFLGGGGVLGSKGEQSKFVVFGD